MSVKQQIQTYLCRVQERKRSQSHRCSICHEEHGLRWHGSYQRTIITLTTVQPVPVRRLFCTLCRHTFSLLPAFAIKFHRYAKSVIRTALGWLKTQTFEAVASRFQELGGPAICPLTLYLWRQKFA